MAMYKIVEAKTKMKGWWRRFRASGCVDGWPREHFAKQSAQPPRVCHPTQRRKRLQKRRAGLPQHVVQPKAGTEPAQERHTAEPTENCHEDHSAADARDTGSLLPPSMAGDASLCANIQRNQSLAGQLRNAIMRNREIRQAERTASARLQKLDQKHIHWDLTAKSIQRKIDSIESAAQDVRAKELPALQEKLAKAQAKRDRAKILELDVDKALNLKWRDHSQNVDDLLMIFDEMLVDNDIVPANEEDDLWDYELSTTSLDDSVTDAPRTAEPASKETPEERQARALVDKYISMRMKLYVMESNLDDREHRFNELADERDAKIAAGEDVESSIQFDMARLEDTRRHTRNLAQAEEEFEAAKAAAVAAGVQVPGSEVESGFVDDVNDGYRVSYDEAIKTLSNPEVVRYWLDGIPDAVPVAGMEAISDKLSADALDAVTGGRESVELDEWEADSVAICESSSMVAEGPWRKRIDKWRGAYAQQG